MDAGIGGDSRGVAVAGGARGGCVRLGESLERLRLIHDSCLLVADFLIEGLNG